jgi:3-methyladenine DNA glycosylase AlkD
MNEYVSTLKLLFEANRNEDNAPHMERYMKHRFRFYGLKKPARLDVLKTFLKQNGLPKIEEVEELIQLLWDEEYRELHYIGCDILEKLMPKLPIDSIHLFEFMIVNQSWWDTVDRIAIRLAGELFKRFPEIENTTSQRFVNSSNFWLNRTSIIYQLKYKSHTNVEILMQNILQHAHQKEFFIQKGIGWALREYAKTDANFVRDFVAKHELASLSRREALKNIE